MSSLEPKTQAKVILNTTKGVIEIDIWSKELPNTSREFISNCLNQKFNDLKFITSSNLIQFPNINTTKIIKESHPRIKCKRGYVGISQDGESIFITLKEIPEFTNFNIFGKINQDSYYIALKISQGEVDNDGNPIFPVKVISSEVIDPYFDDLVKIEEETVKEPAKKKAKTLVKMNYNDDEDEDDDEEEEFSIKSAIDVKNGKSKKMESTEEIKRDSEADSNEEQQQKHLNIVEKKEVEDETSENGETYGEEKVSNIPVIRDPSIDSEYDSDLDLEKAESISLSKKK
ncbi:predicted protein [Candida tropicalis MYA-3404]|uniref:PPIase cyclophilin-type domain-containing protein n=1 Tax=Candida tropicalis (strain ATCC MYA-3404 / T1) TaxID=294747 RepID=C5M379_CANTT|nr:predicted protein [Candida tropicalis MYA-3404]EER35779.1 predicted protein [Candida tropicalis MYA-3404]KAG4409893.1 hypothetical protein JTP64_000531 [Candida tropicalis]